MDKSIAEQLAEWIDIESISGNEGNYGDALARALRTAGFDVEFAQVSKGRHNLLARAERPEVVFCTHLDTVPPFFPPRVERGTVHGRGACDAKGQALAMLLAAQSLVAEGERRVGFLFTVGEEVDSLGAQHANQWISSEPARRDGWAPRYTIVGEP
ncbi:MAG: M20/M25/M40 family metallo-hydrolase, partial [Planctomycetota bacterium]